MKKYSLYYFNLRGHGPIRRYQNAKNAISQGGQYAYTRRPRKVLKQELQESKETIPRCVYQTIWFE